MDPFAAFKNEVFRPIASIVLPGMLAIAPFVIALANSIPEITDLFKTQPAAFFLFFTGASTVTGMLLENIGSSIERGIDQCMEVEYLPGADSVWAAYLALKCEETYARKYLGTLVTRLKFINSMIPAVVLFGVGVATLHWQLDRWRLNTIVLALFGIFALGVWLFKTSIELSEAALFSRFSMLKPGHGIALDTSADSVSRFRHFAYVITELRSSRVTQVNYQELGALQLFVQVSAFMLAANPYRKGDKPLLPNS